MSDFLVIRIPFNKPDKPEIIKFLPNIPINWKKYLKGIAKKEKKEGRYLVANLKYDLDYFYPERKKKSYKKLKKRTEA
jgi:hypothetical protein